MGVNERGDFKGCKRDIDYLENSLYLIAGQGSR